jgi:oxygen-independent coproporphyrinogen-3 oxidase
VDEIEVICNIELNMKSLEEFDRILLKNIEKVFYEINVLEFEKEYIVKINTKDTVKEFRYRKVEKLYDQVLLMVKNLLLQINKKNYKWGTLIGVRPSKLYRKFLEDGISHEEIKVIFKEIYLVSEEKIELLKKIVEKELKYLNDDKINIYVGIPFCPTKCKYCSFASYELKGLHGKSYSKFVDTLLEEVKFSGSFLKSNNYEIESFYIGGGTPTTLKENDLEEILKEIKENFDLSKMKEFTVEAGRIDTITYEKLEIMKKYGVQRISINPQTFNEKTLKRVNRYFDKNQFDDIYRKAKEMGFLINMDFIIGLPGETTEDILYTLENIKNYEIENLTIHTLALKKASNLFREGHVHEEINNVIIEEKINAITEEKKLKPYYMYRQKNTAEWGENIGYSVEGKESLFNIQIIEEAQSTFGLGGGAITKYVFKNDKGDVEIERIVNPKDPIVYINEVKDRFDKKVRLFSK